MIWFLVIVAIVMLYVTMTSSRSSEPVPVVASELGTSGKIDAIEYFWRPG